MVRIAEPYTKSILNWKMAEERSQTKLHGYYRSQRKKFSYMRIEGDDISYHEPGRTDNNNRIEIHYGDFHATPPNIADIREELSFTRVLETNYFP